MNELPPSQIILIIDFCMRLNGFMKQKRFLQQEVKWLMNTLKICTLRCKMAYNDVYLLCDGAIWWCVHFIHTIIWYASSYGVRHHMMYAIWWCLFTMCSITREHLYHLIIKNHTPFKNCLSSKDIFLQVKHYWRL